MTSCTENVGGKGASLSGLFSFKRNDVLYIVVGQMGTHVNSDWGGSGGGASFVVKRGDSLPYEFSLDSCTIKRSNTKKWNGWPVLYKSVRQ